jgi:hypothetical protein
VSAIQYHAILGYLPLPTSLSPKKHRFHWNWLCWGSGAHYFHGSMTTL